MTKLVRLSLIAAAGLATLVAQAQTQIIARIGTTTTAAKVAKAYGITLRDVTANAPFALFTTSSEAASQAALVAMATDPNIVWAEGDENVTSPEDQSKTRPQKGGGLPAVGDRTKLQQINTNLLTQINWSPTLAASAGGVVRLAILDTGLSSHQPALWAKVDASANFIEKSLPAYDKPFKIDSNGNGTVDDGVGHGTMIAGIVDQVAPQVHLVIARVADSDGLATGWTLIKGLAFAVNAKAQIANVSLGARAPVEALTDVMDWCEANNLLVVSAAGNGAEGRAYYPARISKIICVSGVDMNDLKASFSNWDKTCDVAAPAVGFASQFWDGKLAVWSGTSFASPVVAASLADCLRRSGPVSLNTLRKACKSSGVAIDSMNPAYKSMLGSLIDFQKLNQTLAKP